MAEKNLTTRWWVSRLIGAVALTLTLGSPGTPAIAKGPTPEPSMLAPSASEADPQTRNRPLHSQQSLGTFFRAWIAASLKMQRTGKTRAFAKMSDRRCEPCNSIIKLVDSIYSNGGWIKVKQGKVVRIGAPHRSGGHVTVRLTRKISPTKYKESKDSTVTTLAGGKSAMSVTVKRSGSGWRVLNYSMVP